MRTVFSIMLGLVVVLGFAIGEATAQTSTNRPVQLTPEMFTGYELTLISDKNYHVYSFPYRGVVSESFGQKGVFGADEGWRIDNSNTLTFTALVDTTPAGSTNSGFANPVTHSLQFQSFGDKIVVTTDGQKFTRSKFKRPN
jgi:hypothetical protein